MGVGGGGEKNKKNSCKGEGKEKKFKLKEGPIVTFSASLSSFQNVWGSEINNITRHTDE